MARGDAAEFERCRGACFAAAYRMLGSVADAEDVVQDTWLRWSAEDRGDVVNAEAYLVRVATRAALNKLRSVRARREDYVGPWLPEPLVTDPGDAAEQAATVESVSTALLVVLETLSPLERAVFVLHDVFGYQHSEIAETLERSAASVRQLGHRAREHVHARRPRFSADGSRARAITERFVAACRGGDVPALMELLSPEITLLTDGGGKIRAARNPVRGAAKVARFLTGSPRRQLFAHSVTVVQLGGEPGVLSSSESGVHAAITLGVIGNLVERIDVVLNPDKLTALDSRTSSVPVSLPVNALEDQDD